MACILEFSKPQNHKTRAVLSFPQGPLLGL